MDSRQEFEAWYRENVDYVDADSRRLMFIAWQAARQPKHTREEWMGIIRNAIDLVSVKERTRKGCFQLPDVVDDLVEAGILTVKDAE